ncbi:Translation initiation factor 4B [Mycena kentingensis (nom. inval.)]|nr:Translation initiation factor 4B [Mycena kentingensis (nom. inval.)]
MPPKRAKKVALSEFLGDSTLGSWADEMDSLPSAPAARTDDDQARGDRYGRRDDFMATRPDRQAGPPREDLPLPTAPPYTAFIGNLAFDLTDLELGDFFGGDKIKSVKIIKDRDEKPKGFGYIEFEDLDALKEALDKSGASFSGRTIRVSVAEPPKERAGFEDDSKFDNPWRRDGPVPALGSREPSRRRFDGPPPIDRFGSATEGPSDWRAGSRPPARTTPLDTEAPSFRRKNSGFTTPDVQSPADKDEVWVRGANFRAAPPAEETNSGGNRFGSRGRSDMGPPPVVDEGDWRSSRPKAVSRDGTSPNSSTPPTPQLSRRKLELLPRSGNVSTAPSPLSSPKIGPTPTTASARANPFGVAKPVDVSNREKEVAERVERERLTMSRTSSRTGTERTFNRTRTPPPQSPKSPKLAPATATKPAQASTVRPSFSFANAAAKKENVPEKKAEEAGDADVVEQVAESVSEYVQSIEIADYEVCARSNANAPSPRQRVGPLLCSPFVMPVLARDEFLSPSPPLGVLYIVGITLCGLVGLALAVWLIVYRIRHRATKKRDALRDAAFLRIKSVHPEKGSPLPENLQAIQGSTFSRSQLTRSIVLPEKSHGAATNDDILDYHRQSGNVPKPFSFALSAASTSPRPSHSPRSSWQPQRSSIASSAGASNRFSVLSSASSIESSTTGVPRKVRQLFSPVLPDELLLTAVGERLTLVQAFDDGWVLVGRDNSAFASTTKSLFKSTGENNVELGVVPSWCFIKPAKGLRVERPMRSSSLGITVQVDSSAPARQEVLSWSNF